MAITSSAPNGIIVETFAKDSRLSAANLGSQAAAAADEIIVPNAIGTNNEGTLEASPSYVGRLVMLRPLSVGATALDLIVNGGTGYTVSDVLTVGGGTLAAGADATQITVDSVTGGVIDGASVTRVGEYSAAPSNPVSVTGGTGNDDATFDLSYTDVEETRFVTADVSNTLTVHEDWTVAPEQNNNWGLCYIIADAATLTGITLDAVSNIYTSLRRFQCGGAGGGSNDPAFFALLGGSAWRLRDSGATNPALRFSDGGVFQNGYIAAGLPVGGGYMFGINNSAAENVVRTETGSVVRLYDLQLRSGLASLNWDTLSDDGSVREIRGSKIFDTAQTLTLFDYLVRDAILVGAGTTSDLAVVDAGSDIVGVVLDSTHGWDSADDGLTEELTIKDCTFVANSRHVRIHDDKTWDFVNPVGWVATSTFISFEVDDLNEVRRKFSLDLLVQQFDGTAILRALTMIFEGGQNDNLPVANQELTSAAGTAASDILEELYTFPSSVFTTLTFSDFALKVYKYGFSPFVTTQPVTAAVDRTISLAADPTIVTVDQAQAAEDARGLVVRRQAALAYDGQSVNFTVGATLRGLTSGATGTIVIDTDAGTSGVLTLDDVVGEFEDNEPIRDDNATEGVANANGAAVDRSFHLIHFDGGTGTPAPAIGDVITGGTSGKTGVVVELLGDVVSGFLLLEQSDAVAFTNNEGLTSNAGGSTWAALADTSGGGSSANLRFFWLVDAAGAADDALVQVYEYLAAFMAKRLHPLAFRDQAGTFTDFTAEARSDAGGTGNDVEVYSSPAANHAFYFQDEDTLFSSIHLDLVTVFTGTPTVVWEYWNGSWTNLATAHNLVDGTNNFLNADMRIVSWDLPTDAVKNDPGTGINAYSVRARLSVLGTGTSVTADQLWTDRVFEDVHVWGEDEVPQLLFSGTAGFFTERNVANTKGVWVANRGAGTVEFLTADDGTQFVPPSTVTLKVTIRNENNDLLQGIRVRFELTDGTLIADGETNASGVFSSSFIYTGDVGSNVIARKKPFEDFDIPVTIASTGFDIPIRMAADVDVDLP